jgi:hypothetical protein
MQNPFRSYGSAISADCYLQNILRHHVSPCHGNSYRRIFDSDGMYWQDRKCEHGVLTFILFTLSDTGVCRKRIPGELTAQISDYIQ